LSLEIEKAVLEKACKEMIETIFVCLPNAFLGTIYSVGKMPELIVERITSGLISNDRKTISWGLPANSVYNPPGRPWIEYRDQPDRPLEAMSWCVGRQKSWTAEDPAADARSVRRQMEAGLEDYHHMEPVLVRKSDLNLDEYPALEYPRNYNGDIIWNDSDYIVVAVIKIHFRPRTITMNSHETRVIKKLSRSLGTELLSYQLRQDSMEAMEKLARDRVDACNILSDSLRNAITKSGLIFSLLKQEVGYLRAQWEHALLSHRNEKSVKEEAMKKLNSVLADINEVDDESRELLTNAHNRYLGLWLPPEQGERWLEMRIEDKWNEILDKYHLSDEKKAMVYQAINELKESLGYGRDPAVIGNYDKIPEDLKNAWVNLIYQGIESFEAPIVDRIIEILGNPLLVIPSRERSQKNLIQLKALAQTMNQLEKDTNFLLHQVLNGDGDKS
jgi:hypothetical protein